MGRPSPPPAQTTQTTQTTRRPSLPSSPAPAPAPNSHHANPNISPPQLQPIDSNRPRRSLPPIPLGINIDDLDAVREEGLPAYEEEPEDDEVNVGPVPLDQLELEIQNQRERGRVVPDQPEGVTPGTSRATTVGPAQASGVPRLEGGQAGEEVPKAGLKRFGRWRDWVEKRANERDEDEGRSDRRAVRRELPKTPNPPSYDSTLPGPVRYLPPAAYPTPLPNTSLLRIDYGSSFIPHSNASIACALPILGGRLVILGTSTGLRVLNTDDEDNPTRSIWYGLPVWDLKIVDSTSSEPQEGGPDSPSHTHTPKGTIAVLCGGVEDSSKISKPKRSSGSELRLYSLSSLISLARYSALQPKSYAGIGLCPIPAGGKGKDRSKEIEWTMIDRSSIGSLRSLSLTDPTPAPASSELPLAWSKDYTLLPCGGSSGGGGGKGGASSDVQLLTTFSSPARIFVAVGTSTHVVIHGCYPSPFEEEERGNLRFNASRTFYLPAQPSSISFIKLPSNDLPIPQDAVGNGNGYEDGANDVSSLFSYDDRASIRTGHAASTTTFGPTAHSGSSTSTSSPSASPRNAAPPPHTDGDSTSIPSLGLYVSFGSKACLIRVSDSAVLDFKLKKPGSIAGSGSSGGKGDWGSLETLELYGGAEVYVLTRGKETFLLSAPFEIPSHFNTPLATVLWPESPCSILSSVEYTSASATNRPPSCPSLSSSDNYNSENVNIRLIATSFTGNLHIQQLTFSTSLGAGQNRAKPFASTTLGAMARVVHGDTGTGAQSIDFGQGQGQHGGEGGGAIKGRGGCYVRYKKGDRDWRVVRLEKE
ncbi:hypothetical protein IAT40_004817 [Kwoniella sp. CBS 6097]